MRKTVMPLSELAEFRGDNLAWALAVPEYVPQDEVLVNVGRLGRIARLGGTGHLRVQSEAGELTSYSTSVSSVDEGGSATASGSATILKSDLIDANSTVDDMTERSYEYQWADSTLTINTSELSDRIIKEDRFSGKVRDPKEWSYYIDQALRKGLRQTAKQNLVDNVPGTCVLTNAFVFSFTFGLVSILPGSSERGDYPVADFMNGSLGKLIALGATFPLSNALFEKFRNGLSFKERRWSFVPAYQLDRLLAVNALTRATKIVKAGR